MPENQQNQQTNNGPYCHYQMDYVDGSFSCFLFQKGGDENGEFVYRGCPFLREDIFTDNGSEKIGIKTKDGRLLLYCEQFLSSKRPLYLGNGHYHRRQDRFESISERVARRARIAVRGLMRLLVKKTD